MSLVAFSRLASLGRGWRPRIRPVRRERPRTNSPQRGCAWTLWTPLSRGAVVDFDCFEPVALLVRMHDDAVALVEILPLPDGLPAQEAGLRRDLRLRLVSVRVLHRDLVRCDGRDRAFQVR